MWGAAMDFGEWLKGLGLGQYEATFREHEIDADVLPDLTEADLEKIGLSLGARKRLMKGIAGLASKEAPPSARAPAPPPETSAGARLQQMDLAERRLITVIFCDLVGSTSLAGKLDAEDWRNLVNAYLDEASAAVTGLGGHVLKKLGDGLMALFGYPQAQENDAERAVRAALAIQRALAALNARNADKGAPELAARIEKRRIFGRVEADERERVLEVGEALVSGRVGAAEPQPAPLGERVQRRVLQELRRRPFDERVRRLAESCAELHDQPRLANARLADDEGQLAFALERPLPAPPEMIELLLAPDERGRRPRAAAPPAARAHDPIKRHGRGYAPELVRALVLGDEQASDLTMDVRGNGLDSGPVVVEASGDVFGEAPNIAARVQALAEPGAVIAPIVDIPLPQARVLSLPPEELRRRQMTAMTAWSLAAARQQPVALAFEDLHWADPTSLDLLRALAERGAQAPLFIIATARPEFRPPWGMRSHHSVISLAPLARTDVVRMVGEIASRHALAKDVVEGVSERTGGVPLFVEEVTRLLLERGTEGGAQTIPPTLQQSLAARLDRLGEAREVAQIGAVLGRDFSHALLASVAAAPGAAVADRGAAGLGEARYRGGLASPALQSALDRLAEADILIAEGVGHQATYRFKHALIQDAAYESLLKSRRQSLHRRAAVVLREAAAEPEAIAHHYAEAGLDDLAIEWWGKAGDQALRRSAFQEAIAHLGKAIAMADTAWGAIGETGTSDPAISSLRLKLQADYGRAVMWSKGFGADETKAALDRAQEIAAATQDPVEQVAAYYGRWAWSIVRGELRSAREIAEAFLRETEEEGRTTEAGVAHRVLGLTCVMQGELALARPHVECALRDYAPDRDRESRFRFGWDSGIIAAAQLAWAMWFLGRVGRARQLIEQAIRDAIDSRHAATLVHTRWMETILDGYRHDAVATVRAAESLVRLGKELGMDLHAAVGEAYASWARGRLDDPEFGAGNMRKALETYVAQGYRIFVPYFLGLRAELEAATEGADVALTSIGEGLALAGETGERVSDSFLHRLRGELLLRRDSANPGPAEQAFQSAIAIAKDQGARSYELLAALALAKLYKTTGRPADAHAVLAPALEGFTPTPEMPEIAEAMSCQRGWCRSASVVKATSLSQLNDGYGSDSGPSRGEPCRRATKLSVDFAY
jgi:class 3 adenylate cyclase/predicted ATPase